MTCHFIPFGFASIGWSARDAVADRCRQDLNSFVVQQSFQLCSALLEHRPKLYFLGIIGIAVYDGQFRSVMHTCCLNLLAPVKEPMLCCKSSCLIHKSSCLHASRLTCSCCSPYLQLQCYRIAPRILPLHPQGVEWPAGWSAPERMRSSSGAWGVLYSWCMPLS